MASERSSKRARSNGEAAGASAEPLPNNTGYGNEFQSEALPGALPVGQNNPQQCPYGLYAEQLSGTAFTAPRHSNRRSWLYRIKPSVCHRPFEPSDAAPLLTSTFTEVTPNQLRWRPFPLSGAEAGAPDRTFLEGLATLAGCGGPSTKSGLAVHIYTCNVSMTDSAFCNADGDMLIVPQQGALRIRSEFGVQDVPPRHICIMPRGVRFQVAVDGPSRGYVCEIFQGQFKIPDLGPIGANGLANARDFVAPDAAFEDRDCDFTIHQKFNGALFRASLDHSPFNVVAWHGNLAPFTYNIDRFNTMNSVSYDHPDPSIYTIVTAQSNTPGTAVCDFVCFPPRWMVMERSFRPPYFHRNVCSEFMGLIDGSYDAKSGGFVPGGASLHSCMTPHGPDEATFKKASTANLEPEFFNGGLAFMFETALTLNVTPWALQTQIVEEDYYLCWAGMPKLFNGTPEGAGFDDL